MASGSGIVMAMLATAAQAQQAAEPALESVTVQGVRGFGSDVSQIGSFRGAKVMDTPMSVSVLPRDLLDAQQAGSLNDTLRNIAGVNNSQTTTVVTSGQSVRGIPLDNRNAYRMDGSLPIINLLEMPNEDKERVELMKGASALYYGFASPAGVVNLTMKRPTTDPLVELDGFGNMYGGLGAHLDVGGTTAGGFGYRINTTYAGVNPGIRNTTGTRSLLAGAFDYSPIEDITIQVDLEHIYKSQDEPGVFRWGVTGAALPAASAANPYPTVLLPDVRTIDPKNNMGPSWALYRAEETNALMHNVWTITPAWAFTFDVGDSKFSRNRVFNTVTPTNLSTGAGVLAFQFSTQQNENRNFRFQLDGKVDTWILTHNLNIGMADNVRDSYSVNATQITCAGGTYNAGVSNTSFACQAGITTVGGVGVNYLNPLTYTAGLTRQLNPNMPVSGNVTRVDDMGFYAFDRIEATEYLELIGGVRLENYHENIIKPVPSQTFHGSPTPTAASVVVKPLGDDTLSVFASYIEALETTASAPATAANVGFQPPPTPSFDHELGIKYEPWKGLLAQVSYFNIGRGNATTDANNNWGLNGRAKFNGFDASITGDITDDLSVAVSGTLLMSKVVSGTPTQCAVITTTCKTFVPTLIGRNVDNTAKAYGSLFAQYKLDDVWSTLQGVAVNAGVYYVGPRYLAQTSDSRLGDYTLLDLGASYSTDAFQYPLTFRLNARNVGNRRYWAASGANLAAVGQPADVEFSLETHL
jgi:iron complex outermembrane receptor protein